MGGQVQGVHLVKIIQAVLGRQPVLLQPVGQIHDLFQGDGHLQQGVKHLFLPFFDALGNLHFPFPGEQGNGAHLFQV